MTECWSPGDLRAAIDLELPPEALERIAAHLEVCGECRAVHAELEARAQRMAVRMEELLTVPQAPRVARRTGSRLRWAVPLGLAAGLAIGWLVLPKRVEAPHNAEAPRPVATQPLAAPPQPAPQRVAQTVRPASPRPRRAKPARRPESIDFVALDDRPIETGVVMRVSWGAENLQADIIFGPDGSARAYRLVNANFKY